jgi:hypothetical protein
MHKLGTIREFRTEHYRVVVEALEEFDVDLSFDDDGSVSKDLDNGNLIVFCAHAYVEHMPTGKVIGEDYLGNCIYKSFDDFVDHRECGKQNRKWAKQGKDGCCGSYFSQMISEAIGEAREHAKELSKLQLRSA